MASIKVKFRPSSVDGHEGTIYYQIIHERKVRQVVTLYHVFPAEWDAHRSMVKANMQQSNERRTMVLLIRERIGRDVERLTKIDRKLNACGLPYMADDVVDEFNRYSREYSLFNFMENIIDRMRLNGKIRTSETYKAALRSFRNFRNGNDLMLDSLTSEIMDSYEAWLRNRGIAPNTISFYTRILRAVYNRAVDDDITEDRNPFRHVYTGIEKTVKRALPLAAMKRIKQLDLSLRPTLDFARDMFMMSFYLRGMSFIDMAFLRKTDRQCGSVMYRRRKTGQRLTIGWTREMQEILDKYPENKSGYLLPIIRTPCTNERSVYRNSAYNINHNLKKIARILGLDMRLTMYVARHSWASAAKAKGVPLSVISEGMGHDSEATTQIYQASLDASVVDRANAMILKSLK